MERRDPNAFGGVEVEIQSVVLDLARILFNRWGTFKAVQQKHETWPTNRNRSVGETDILEKMPIVKNF